MESLAGQVVSLDRPRSEVTVRDARGSDMTFVASSADLSRIEEGATVNVEHRSGSDVAESVVVKQPSER
jgi:hypothetical protein